ncbi:sensor histidine kinase [Variovorax sp. TBS-050B]|uniref:sensor histidine kinase n=1 Tax=Variovorax sp. TBS-050B TaxID=2940551 RepID=UPI0024767198|nr:sensor histidine kinase [Variovorax sp. TBS-050B]
MRDEGIGIAPADLPHLFERYRRAGGCRLGAGHGLGLWLVLTVAQRHGGRVACTSTPGQAACSH